MENRTLLTASNPLNFTQQHAFVIGIDAYQKVSTLKTAVADAEKIASVLSEQQGFTVHPPLLNATTQDILYLLENTLPQLVGKDDRVFFYFAGHGIAADSDDGPAGYIVPVDADPARVDTFIPMDTLQEALNDLPCRHLLLVMDCCFSGAFRWSSSHRDIIMTMPKKIYKERFDRFINDPAWQVITSSAYDQKALDVLDGNTTGDRGEIVSPNQTLHSPFAQALFDGLNGDADVRTDSDEEGDGVITATELYAYIRDKVEPQSIGVAQQLRQTPGFFPLQKHDKGEFIFLKPNHRLNLPPIPKRSPYKGLVSFDESDADLFYGRDHAIEALREKSTQNTLLVVSGASGTGKSSVIKAGLLPLLRKQACQILDVMRPGANPMLALEKALAQIKTDSSLTDSSDYLGAVLVIDQFEELITRCEDTTQRSPFYNRLRELLDDKRIYKLIITVRSDFEPQFNSGALKQQWQQARISVPPFSMDELKDVVVLPTMQEVLIFDPPELVDTIVEEVVQSPGALPLLSYTLNELYEAYRTSGRQDRALKLADYEKLGGVMGALRNRADGVYATLKPPEQETMRKIMLRLVSVEGELAGKRVAIEDLHYSDEQIDLVDKVIEKLVDARLIVKGKDYIEPAHDALVRAWKLLHDWTFSVGKDKLILGAKLSAIATEFASSRNSGLLWNNNPNLPVLLKEANETKHWFNAKEITFLTKSKSKKVSNRRLLFASTSFVIIVLVFATIYSAGQNFDARNELQRSVALSTSRVAANIINNDNLNVSGGSERALQQSIGASHLVDPTRDQGLLQSLLVNERPNVPAENLASSLVTYLSLHPNVKYLDIDFTIRELATSPDFKSFVAGGHAGNNGVVKLYNTETGTSIFLRNQPNESIYTVAWSPDGQYIVASGVSGELLIWDATALTSQPIANINLPFGLISSVVFSQDSAQIAITGNDDNVILYALSELLAYTESTDDALDARHELMISEAGYSIAFSQNGDYLVSGGNWGKTLWQLTPDATKWETEYRYELPNDMTNFGGPPNYQSIAINNDGSIIAAAGKAARMDKQSSIWLWSKQTNYLRSKELIGLPNPTTLSFSHDGRRLVAGGGEGKVVVWDVQTNDVVAKRTIVGQLDVSDVIFSPDDNSVLASTEDGMVTIWAPDNNQVTNIEPCQTFAVSPDGKKLIKGRSGDVAYGQGGGLDYFENDAEKTPISMKNKGHSKGVGKHLKHGPQADTITCVKYSKDGSTVVSAASNNTIQFWQVKSDSLQANGESIVGSAFEFALDERLIAVLEREASEEQAMLIRLYDTQNRSPVGFWLAQNDSWTSIVNKIQGLATLEDLNTKLCAKLLRNMSHAQWQQWVSSEIDYIVQCPKLPINK